MLTGVVTNDLSYLCYLILKDGCYFTSKEEEEEEASADQLLSFDDWFSNLQ